MAASKFSLEEVILGIESASKLCGVSVGPVREGVNDRSLTPYRMK